MATKVATKQTRFAVTANVTVPKGNILPTSKLLKEAFQTGMGYVFDLRDAKVGTLQSRAVVPPSNRAKGKGSKSKPKPKPKPKPKARIQTPEPLNLELGPSDVMQEPQGL